VGDEEDSGCVPAHDQRGLVQSVIDVVFPFVSLFCQWVVYRTSGLRPSSHKLFDLFSVYLLKLCFFHGMGSHPTMLSSRTGQGRPPPSPVLFASGRCSLACFSLSAPSNSPQRSMIFIQGAVCNHRCRIWTVVVLHGGRRAPSDYGFYFA